MSKSTPTIDLSACGLLVKDDGMVNKETLEDIGKQLYDALSTTGFAYLSNHGIPKEKVDNVHKIATKFYALPDDEKRRYHTRGVYFCYDPMGSLKADLKHVDYQEGFRITGDAFESDDITWPNITGFRENCFDLAEYCRLLIWRLLKALGIGMKLKDQEYFYKTHSLMNRKGNGSVFKLIHYPPVLSKEKMSEHRIGEHHDSTAMTLVFQDDMGGLQRKDENGDFIEVTPIPDMIVLNLGETMEKWSNGRLKATIHRVVPPDDPEKRKQIRRSIVYFGDANFDVLVEPLQFEDGRKNEILSDENPLTIKERLQKRFEELGLGD